MKILDLNILKGPNLWSVRKHKLVVVKLDLEELEEIPTHKINGFYNRIQKALPSLQNHYCSEGYPGGFFERIKSGTWMGHVMEHIALEIQTLAGMNCGFGRTRQAGSQKGIYNVVFEYQEEQAGIYAAESAFKITDSLVKGSAYNIPAVVERLKSIFAEYSPGPSTSAIIRAATERDIPHIRLDSGSLIQLGYGINQKRINATMTDYTSSIAVDIAADKALTKKILRNAAIPVPEGVVIRKETELEGAIHNLGFPLVIKPLNSNHGKGVTTDIRTQEEASRAFNDARIYSDKVIVEKHFRGNDYRFLVIDYKLCAVARRVPANIIGNGISTVQQLIEQTNKDSLRGDNHEKVLTKIRIDDHTIKALKNQQLTLYSVPPEGKIIFVKQTANLSTGGTSEDVTEQVHPDIIKMAEKVSRSIGLDICGIDMVLTDINGPFREGSGGVVEVNAAPGFRMHTHPLKGQPRQPEEDVINMLFPYNNNGRIPVVAITGTNGKTTTTRLLAYMARIAGYNTGYTTTEGIYIGDKLIEEGDCTGPASAAKVLHDKTVDFAVLECARGGMLRSGLAFDRCDVGIITNVAEDHIGLKDIDSIEEMAKVKSIVAEVVKPDGFAILNADNDFTYNMSGNLKCKVALFSTDPQNDRVRNHFTAGGLTAILEKGSIFLVIEKKKVFIETVEKIPLSFHGKASFMIENIMAATLAAHIRGISINHIAQALQTFVPSFENNPGRLNIFRFSQFNLMIDYAHNFHGITALGSFIKQWEAGYNIGIISAAGDRRDIDIINVGTAAALIFDSIIIRLDEDKRGRKDVEISGLILQGIRKVKPLLPVTVIPDELDAIQHAVSNAPEGSLVVLLSEKVKKCIAFVKKLQQEEQFSYSDFATEQMLN